MHTQPDCDHRPWPVKTVDVPIGGDIITLELVACFDDVLDDIANQHPDNTDLIPYFADLWPSAHVLATHLVALYPDLHGKSLLELGCGAGLPSIAAARRGAIVTATDFHPQNQPYFEANARRNDVAQIHYQTMDWRQPPTGITYDLIIGSDLLYEAQQIETLSASIVLQLAPNGTAILADPGRKHIQQAADTLERMGLHVHLDIRDETFILTLDYRDGTRSCR
ncbi:MAG TPA: hypothetical protein DCS43_07915 [Verrucomicrobia bacterium]|nr:hypothetical protein [Verrucomicrobiota bacterium]